MMCLDEVMFTVRGRQVDEQFLKSTFGERKINLALKGCSPVVKDTVAYDNEYKGQGKLLSD
jgi:hypothetical protein